MTVALYTSTGAGGKSQFLDVSGLSISANANTGAPNLVKATAPASGKAHVEFTITAVPTSETGQYFFLGVIDGAKSVGPDGTGTYFFDTPGKTSGCAGATICLNGSTGNKGQVAVNANGGALSVNTLSYDPAAGDVIIWEIDPDATTISWWCRRSGTNTLLASRTLTSLVPTTWVAVIGATMPGFTGTINFGATAFASTPSSGYSSYEPTAPSVSVTASGSAPAITGASTATVSATASAAGVAPTVSSVASSNPPVSGTASGAAPSLTGTATARAAISATANGSAPTPTGAATATISARATAGGDVGAITGAASSALRATGTAIASIGAITGTSTVMVSVRGSASGSAPDITGIALSGSMAPATGSASGAAPDISGTASAKATVSAQASGAAPTISGVSTARATVSAVASGSAPSVSGVASGRATVSASGVASINAPTGSAIVNATGGVSTLASGSVGAITGQSSVTLSVRGVGAGDAPAITGASSITIAVRGAASGSIAIEGAAQARAIIRVVASSTVPVVSGVAAGGPPPVGSPNPAFNHLSGQSRRDHLAAGPAGRHLAFVPKIKAAA